MGSEPPGAFAGHLVRTLTGGALTMLISLGYRAGLFEAAAAGPATSAGLADRAGLQERYVREWLGAMVTGGFFNYDAVTGEYTLPAEHACFLTGPGAANAAPMAAMLQAFAGALPELEQCFRAGGGLAPGAFAPHFAAAGAEPGDTWRRVYDEHLVGGFLGAVPGLAARLAAGAAVLDLGCGTGHAVTVAARAFPTARFLGLDIDGHAVATAQSRRARLGLGNAAFVIGDAAALPARPRFDVITASMRCTTSDPRRRCCAGYGPRWPLGECSSWWTRSSPATWRPTWGIRWRPCAMGSASCTAPRSA